ncbi:hypothetical protein [Ectothiorhodospira marina]|uniref:Sodium Bile acid symporter family protein n=1 Tax=Ectothiorhodospira marina TaxID=1396821 RepID=A0A1H7PXD5_9GAMM|nr:hypothetical protein [Ectothiorhodospira marina]SEL40226.1 Sodium Bile acid symporter family protein [Ectothiorhodospira marina]
MTLNHLWEAFADRGFLVAASLGNFLIIPVLAWLLMWLGPEDPVVQLGIFLVLLVICADWFITFTQLGGDDTRWAIAFAPVSLLLQIILLPVYLWHFFLGDLGLALVRGDMLLAFFGLIILPLLLALAAYLWWVPRRLFTAREPSLP